MRLFRIGLFTDVYFPSKNGVSTSVYLLWRELRKMGHEAWIIAPDWPDAEPEDGVVRVKSVPYPFFEDYRLGLPNARLLPTRFEVVHSHVPFTLGLWALSLAQKWRVPHVSTFHTHYEKYAHYVPGLAFLDRHTHIIPRLARAFYNRVELVITPTHPVKELVERYRIERPVRVIPTGIDTELLARAPKPEPCPWPKGRRRLLTVSRLGKEKSLDVALRAFAQHRSPSQTWESQTSQSSKSHALGPGGTSRDSEAHAPSARTPRDQTGRRRSSDQAGGSRRKYWNSRWKGSRNAAIMDRDPRPGKAHAF